MKRPILFAILVVVLAFCYFFWRLIPKEEKAAQTSAASAPAVPAIAVTSKPAAATTQPVIQGKVPEMLTDERRRILDSPDLMKTVTEIRLHGTQDEKDWARYAMMACAHVRGKGLPADGGIAASQAESTMPSASPEVTKERRLAYESVSQRCKGLSALNPDDRISLQSELSAGSESNSSELARLHSLASTDEDRWTDEQTSLITRSLYSGDPVLQQEAFFAAQRTIDLNAPSGADRSAAFEQAFESTLVSGPLSDLELQTACVLINHCPSSSTDPRSQNSPNKSVDRLVDEYKGALQAHKDVKSILAIR